MSSRRRFLKRVVGVGAAVTVGPWSHAGNSQEPAGRITGFDHVAVPMRDTEAMVTFYRALGFHVNEGEAICSVHVGDHKINFHRPSLWQRKTFALRAPGATPPCGDFCFVWEGTMTALHRSLAAAGGRDGGRATGTSVYVRDPDQNLVEFIVYS